MHGKSFMDNDTAVTYRRNEDFWERIGSRLAGILVGLALLLLASTLLYWTESQAFQTAKSLDEGMNIVVSLKTIDVVNQENNGKLVHLIGPLSTDEVLYDWLFGVSVHAVKLKRIAEQYQWVEYKHTVEYNEGGQANVETTYSYSQEWRSDLIKSSSFHDEINHQNPIRIFTASDRTWEASRVSVGQFGLSKGLISRISEFHPLPPSYLHPPQGSNVQLFDGAFYYSYFCHDPLHPEIGDSRVRFEYAGISGKSPLGSPTQVSIVAKQLGSELLSYKTQVGDKLKILYYGQFLSKEIFNMEIYNNVEIQNTMVTWGIRFGGWLLVFIGVSLITSRGDWIPIVSELVAMGENLMNLASNMGVNLMNLALSISLSLTVVAMGLISYRPLLGFYLLVIALTAFYLSIIQSRISYRAQHD